MLTVITWLWGDKFGADDVAKLHGGLRRNLRQPFRFLCCTDQGSGDSETFNGPNGPVELFFIEQDDTHLLTRKGCFARLRMFDPSWQTKRSIEERLVCIDLDTIITGPLDPLFDRPEPFVIMQGGNAANPCPYNGALMMLRAGEHPEVWSDFSLEAAAKMPFYSFPDDQGWLAHKIPGAAGWKVGTEHGVYVFQKRGWPGGKSGTALPDDARLVTFINRGPRDLMHLNWVKEHWR